MSDIAALVSDHLEIWTAATERKNGAGRGGGKRVSLYGIERLRSLILELAVRGNLLPQDASDAAASASLVHARKSLSAKASGVRRLRWKPSKPFDAEEASRPLPPGWALARINDTGFYINGLAFKPGDWSDTGWPIIRIQNLTNPTAPYNYAQGDFPDEVVVRDGDLLVSWSATLAAFQWSGEDAILNQHIFRVIHEPALTERPYLRLMLEHAIAEMAESEHAHGLVMTHINRGPFLDHLVKVPPLAEQRRIVAKVDELMALCDALEGESAVALAAHQTLVETLLDTLANSVDAADLAANWSRLEAHFDTLFTTEASVDALKQTILGLAVRGKLVEQNEGDEAAEKLLARLASDETNGGKAGKRRTSTLLDVEDQEVPFCIPDGWVWARFSQVARVRAELVHSLDFPDAFQIAPDVIEKGTGKLLMIRTVAEAGISGPNSRFYAGQIIYSKIRPSLSKAVIAQFDGLCSADMYPLDVLIDAKFMLRLILSEPFLQQVRIAENRIKMPKLNKESLNAFVLPIPPLAEQHRIVAKVDELLSLCDDLKAQIGDAGQTQMRLADALVERAAA